MTNKVSSDVLLDLDALNGLVDELITTRPAATSTFHGLFETTRNLVTHLGVDLSISYGDEWGSVSEVIDTTLDASYNQFLSHDGWYVTDEGLRTELQELRELIAEGDNDEELTHQLCGWLCELALVAVDHTVPDAEIANFSAMFDASGEDEDQMDYEEQEEE